MRFTLVSDGPADRVLLPIIEWVLGQHSRAPLHGQWADLRNLRHPPRTLADRLELACKLYPCDALFVHRDGDGSPRSSRVAEIKRARPIARTVHHVCIVPIQAQAAWLLFDATALRKAAGKPGGRMPLALPPLERIEREPRPKDVLHGLLRQASGLRGRRLREFSPQLVAHRLAELISDFSPLRRLPAFQAFEAEVSAYCRERGA